MSWLPPEIDGTLAHLPSERKCLRCGCVRARHPAGYCSFHGPQECRKYRSMGSVVLTIGWVIAFVIWVGAMIQTYRAARP